MSITGQDIANQARTWIGTQFVHQGRSKKIDRMSPGACDCIGLLLGIIKELNIVSHVQKSDKYVPLHLFDQTDYARQPDGRKLKLALDTYMDQINVDDICIGDVLLIHFSKHPQHVGIVVDGPNKSFNMIHCWGGPDKVVEHDFSEFWRKSAIAAYRFKDISLGKIKD